MTKCIVLVLFLAGLVVGFVGCNDDDSDFANGGGDTNPDINGADNRSDTSTGEVDSLVFVVVTNDDSAEKGYSPVKGATVALDTPGGTRIERTSDANGLVTFDRIDFTLGAATVTAYKADYTLTTFAGFDQKDLAAMITINGAIRLRLFMQEEAPDTVMVSGTVQGAENPDHDIVVNVLGAGFGTQWTGREGNTFFVNVNAGEPFHLQMLEKTTTIATTGQGYHMSIYQVRHQRFEPITENLTDIVLDFADGTLQLTTADVTATLPDRKDSPVRDGSGVGLVCSRSTTFCHGWSQHIDIGENGNAIEATLIWTEPDWIDDQYYTIRVYSTNDGRMLSLANVFRFPQTGEEITLPDVPRWVQPKNPDIPGNLYDTIEWEVAQQEFNSTSYLLERSGRLIWWVDLSPKDRSLTLPDPPSTVDTEKLFGPYYLLSALYIGNVNKELNWWSDVAISEALRLHP